MWGEREQEVKEGFDLEWREKSWDLYMKEGIKDEEQVKDGL